MFQSNIDYYKPTTKLTKLANVLQRSSTRYRYYYHYILHSYIVSGLPTLLFFYSFLFHTTPISTKWLSVRHFESNIFENKAGLQLVGNVGQPCQNFCEIPHSFQVSKFFVLKITMYIVCDYWAHVIYVVPYTWNFSQYVNFTDFAVSRATVKIYSVKILPPRII